MIKRHEQRTHEHRPVAIKTDQFAALVAESGTDNAALLKSAKANNKPGGPLVVHVNCCDLVKLLKALPPIDDKADQRDQVNDEADQVADLDDEAADQVDQASANDEAADQFGDQFAA